MLLMAVLVRESIPAIGALAWGAFAGVIGAFGIAALYRALAIGRMGIVAPVAAVVTGVLPVLVGMVTEGLPDSVQFAGFALALLSIWLVAGSNGSAESRRGIGLAALAGVAFGLFLIAGKQAGHQGIFWPLVSARLCSTVLTGGIALFAATGLRPPPRAVLWPTVWSGLLDSAGNALFIAATRHGRLDVAAVLSSLYPASTVILARVLLKERIGKLQAIGIVCAMVSVALISAR